MMPLRPLIPAQAWLLPPTLGELVPEVRPVRFVAAFVCPRSGRAGGDGACLDGDLSDGNMSLASSSEAMGTPVWCELPC